MKKNITTLIFAFTILSIAISRWSSTETTDHIFYLVAIAGFVAIWVASNLRKGKKSD